MSSCVGCGSGYGGGTSAPSPPGSAYAILQWGATGLTSTVTTRYMTPGWGFGNAGTSAIRMPIPRDGTVQRMYVLHNIPAGNGNNIVYTVRNNGVATALLVTLASTAAVGSNLISSFAVVAGDQIDIQVTKALDVAVSPSNIEIVLELAY